MTRKPLEVGYIEWTLNSRKVSWLELLWCRGPDNPNTPQKEVNCRDINGNEEIDPAISSQTFNKFFSTIGQKIQFKLINIKKHYTDYLTEPATNTFILAPTNTEEIGDIIKALNIPKSIGPNSIPTRPLKQFP